MIAVSAIEYAERGWHVFPVHATADGHCTCDSTCDSPGKHPRTKRGLSDATVDAALIHWWLAKWPDANLGIATGAASGLVVLDIDPRHGGDVSLEELQRRHGLLPATVAVRTGGGGRHLYFAHPRGGVLIRNRTRLAGLAGLDVRGDGGYVVAPPSRHATGQRYAWAQSSHPDEMEPAAVPSWLISLLTERSAGTEGSRANDRIAEGERNSTLASLAGTMRRRGMGHESIAAALFEENRNRCDPPLSDDEVRRIAVSVARYAPAPEAGLPEARADDSGVTSGDFALSDLGNAERLVALHGPDLRYCDPLKTYLLWDGRRWREDDTQEAVLLAGDTVRSLYATAETADTTERRRKIVEHALRSEGAARIGALLQLAQAQIPIRPSELDIDPWLFNVANGTLDLRTGALRAHRREDHLTKLAAVEYDAAAQAPQWTRFLERVLAGDAELIAFLRRAVGYALTGETSEQKLLLLYGTGANGKSTLLETLRLLLGDYARHSDFSTFLLQRGDSVRNDIARLRGARLVTATEMEGGRALAEVVIKQLTGSDTVTARRLYAEFFEFKPIFKLFLAANHKPVIRGTEHAIWRRICLVPFKVTIPAGEQDPHLGETLREELPGILAWAVAGCVEWQREGLNPPPSVRAATEEYRSEMDTLGDFLEACCAVEPAASVSSKVLYQAYVDWAAQAGEKPVARNAFGMRLAERGFERGQRPDSASRERLWRGLRLAAEQPLDLA